MSTTPTEPEIRNPLFARFYARVLEPLSRRDRNRERLMADLDGRVLELGCGAGINFPLYPNRVSEVVAVEPEPYLRQRAEQPAATTTVPINVAAGRADRLSLEDSSVAPAAHARPPARALAARIPASSRSPIDSTHPPRGRNRRHLPEQRGLPRERREIRHAPSAVSKHHDQVAEHPPRLIATTPLRVPLARLTTHRSHQHARVGSARLGGPISHTSMWACLVCSSVRSLS